MVGSVESFGSQLIRGVVRMNDKQRANKKKKREQSNGKKGIKPGTCHRQMYNAHFVTYAVHVNMTLFG